MHAKFGLDLYGLPAPTIDLGRLLRQSRKLHDGQPEPPIDVVIELDVALAVGEEQILIRSRRLRLPSRNCSDSPGGERDCTLAVLGFNTPDFPPTISALGDRQATSINVNVRPRQPQVLAHAKAAKEQR